MIIGVIRARTDGMRLAPAFGRVGLDVLMTDSEGRRDSLELFALLAQEGAV